MKKKKEKPDKWWKEKAWKAFSLWVRLRDSNELGICKCCTCGVEKMWKKMHAGHFVNGRTNSILFDEKNCHAQCYRCNVILSGNWSAYYEYMLNKYGLDTINRLLKQKKQIRKFYKADYQEIIEIYTIEKGLMDRWGK